MKRHLHGWKTSSTRIKRLLKKVQPDMGNVYKLTLEEVAKNLRKPYSEAKKNAAMWHSEFQEEIHKQRAKCLGTTLEIERRKQSR